MIDVLYLARKYLAYHRLKSTVSVASIALIAYTPIRLDILIDQSARQLTERAKQHRCSSGRREIY